MHTKQSITEAYIRYINEEGKRPVSIASFARTLELEESAFNEFFSSAQALENFILSGFVQRTTERLGADETYQSYSVREKLLAFYFTLIEEMKGQRSFITFCFGHQAGLNAWRLSGFKEAVKEYLNQLVTDGVESTEIPNRFNLHKWYADAGILQAISIVQFWVKDDSEQFDHTDGFIERSVNFTMDMITRNGFDSGFELGKFLFQQFKVK